MCMLFYVSTSNVRKYMLFSPALQRRNEAIGDDQEGWIFRIRVFVVGETSQGRR